MARTTTTRSQPGRQDVQFPGAGGDTLHGTLDLPAGEVRATALFAHCFTCSRESHAATRISSALAERGIAVLRFDFTGLGASEGDFADTTFTSNLADLEAAAACLAEHLGGQQGRQQGRQQGGPDLLVGHSLGGAAVLAVAERLPTVRAVAVLGAPSSPSHVEHLLGTAGEAPDGHLEVTIGGRRLHVGRDLVDDLADQPQQERIASLRRPLLILHAPLDEVVGVDEARRIFDHARHPKSFVALDGADHLLSRREDSDYAATVIAAWASRYLPEARQAGEAGQTGEAGENAESAQCDTPKAGENAESARCDTPEAERHAESARCDIPEGAVRVQEVSAEGGFAHDVIAGEHRWRLDEPTSAGGEDSGPNPYDGLLAALGACTSMTMRMYARRKGWDYGATTVTLTHDRIHARDCEECEATSGRVDHLHREIALDPALSEEQRDALLVIADKCPVHHTLTHEVRITTDVAPEEGSA